MPSINNTTAVLLFLLLSVNFFYWYILRMPSGEEQVESSEGGESKEQVKCESSADDGVTSNVDEQVLDKNSEKSSLEYKEQDRHDDGPSKAEQKADSEEAKIPETEQSVADPGSSSTAVTSAPCEETTVTPGPSETSLPVIETSEHCELTEQSIQDDKICSPQISASEQLEMKELASLKNKPDNKDCAKSVKDILPGSTDACSQEHSAKTLSQESISQQLPAETSPEEAAIEETSGSHDTIESCPRCCPDLPLNFLSFSVHWAKRNILMIYSLFLTSVLLVVSIYVTLNGKNKALMKLGIFGIAVLSIMAASFIVYLVRYYVHDFKRRSRKRRRN